MQNEGTASHTLSDDQEYFYSQVANILWDSGTIARIGPYAFTVYAYLLRRAGGKHMAWPGIERIAADTGMSTKQVSREIKTLEREQMIATTKRPGGGNRYRLLNLYSPGVMVAQSTDSQSVATDSQSPEVNTRSKHSGDTHVSPAREGPKPFDLVEAWCDTMGVDPNLLPRSEKSKQAAVAQSLILDGMTVEDVRVITRWLLSQSFRESGIDMFTIRKHQARWIAAGKPESAARPQNGVATSRASRIEQSQTKLAAMARGEKP